MFTVKYPVKLYPEKEIYDIIKKDNMKGRILYE